MRKVAKIYTGHSPKIGDYTIDVHVSSELDSWDLDDFSRMKDLSSIFGTPDMSVEDFIETLETIIGGDFEEATGVAPTDSATWDIAKYLDHYNQDYIRENTYNWAWFGPTMEMLFWGGYTLLMPHLGGDIRGNYGDVVVYKMYAEDFNEIFGSINIGIYIETADGESYNYYSEDIEGVDYMTMESGESAGNVEDIIDDLELEEFDIWD